MKMYRVYRMTSSKKNADALIERYERLTGDRFHMRVVETTEES